MDTRARVGVLYLHSPSLPASDFSPLRGTTSMLARSTLEQLQVTETPKPTRGRCPAGPDLDLLKEDLHFDELGPKSLHFNKLGLSHLNLTFFLKKIEKHNQKNIFNGVCNSNSNEANIVE